MLTDCLCFINTFYKMWPRKTFFKVHNVSLSSKAHHMLDEPVFVLFRLIRHGVLMADILL